jgi:meiotic recombination protein SPO11
MPVTGRIFDLLEQTGDRCEANTPLLDVSRARYLIIVEKDAVFYRLMSDRLFDVLPAILLTGYGFPSVAVRVMANYIQSIAPHLVPLAVVDYNPSGIHIMLQYLRDPSYPVPQLKWLGVRSSQLGCTSNGVPFSNRERRQVQNLIRRLPPPLHQWSTELQSMLRTGMSHQIEGLYPEAPDTFANIVARQILMHDFI